MTDKRERDKGETEGRNTDDNNSDNNDNNNENNSKRGTGSNKRRKTNATRKKPQ